MCGQCAMNLKSMKICNKCKKEKEMEDFHVNRKLKNGRCSNCKECTLKQWRKPSKDENSL